MAFSDRFVALGEEEILYIISKHLSPSIRRRNAQRMDQRKAKREAVGDNTTCVQTQTVDINPSTDETTQTDQHNSDAQAINIPTVLCSGIADKYFFFLLGLRPLHISCVGVGGLSPISISGEYSGKRSMSAGSSGSIYKCRAVLIAS
jgi:hypothetical protein